VSSDTFGARRRTPTSTPSGFFLRCTNQNQSRANMMPVSGESKVPAGSWAAVSWVVTLPRLSICLTVPPTSVTQIVSP